MKKCPYCAEEIQDAAIVCRYCGCALDVGAVEKLEQPQRAPDDTAKKAGGRLKPPPWRRAVTLGLGFAALAAFPRVAGLAQEGGIYPGFLNDLLFHFAANWIIWSLLSLLFLWVWGRSKPAAILVTLTLLGALFAIANWPEIVSYIEQLSLADEGQQLQANSSITATLVPEVAMTRTVAVGIARATSTARYWLAATDSADTLGTALADRIATVQACEAAPNCIMVTPTSRP